MYDYPRDAIFVDGPHWWGDTTNSFGVKDPAAFARIRRSRVGEE